MNRAVRIGALVLALILMLGDIGTAAVSRVTVATTATLIYTAPNTPQGARVLIRNPSAVSVYLGPATVATTTGFEVAAGDAVSVALYPNETIYGVVAAATQVVHVMDGRNGV